MATEVEAWVKLDDRLKELSAEMKQIRDQKAQLSEIIMKDLLNTGQTCKVLNDGTYMSMKTRVQESSINKEYIHETLIDHFKNNKVKSSDPTKLAEDATEAILNNRSSEEKCSLVRTKKQPKA